MATVQWRRPCWCSQEPRTIFCWVPTRSQSSLVAESEETSIDLLTGKERVGNQPPRATATQSDGQPPNLRCPVPEDFPGQQMSAAQLAGRGPPEMKDGVVAVPPELQSQDGVIESS